MVLRCRPNCPPLAKPELKQAKELFDSLSLSAAQNTIRFWSAQGSAGKAPVPETAAAVPEIRA
jgi:hypothetical protein